MSMNKSVIVVLSFVFFFSEGLISPLFGQSTSIPSNIPELEEQISINISPVIPIPLKNVNISLEAFGTDLNRASITWKIDGTLAKKGTGEKSLDVIAGRVGEIKKIEITILPTNGQPIVKVINIIPEQVDIVWESQTYVPPFYKGKAMYTAQENVIVVAIPNFISAGKAVDPKTLVYTWRKDSEVDGETSGYGRNVFRFKGSILLPTNNIQVEVASVGKEKAKASIDLSPINPEVILYERNPLYGVLWNLALTGQQAFDVAEKSVEAFPYFIGASIKNSNNLSYEWSINNQKIGVSSSENSLVLRNEENESGSTLVGVRVSNKNNFLQEGKGSVYLNFNPPKKVFEF